MREADRNEEIRAKPLSQFLLGLDLATRQVIQKNIQAASHLGRHRPADPRSGRTKRRRRFGKKHK